MAANRRFVLVQIPEPTPEDSEARKAGFQTISQLTRKRLALISEHCRRRLPVNSISPAEKASEDLGFRVFKLAESHYRRWRGVSDNTWASALKEMELFR